MLLGANMLTYGPTLVKVAGVRTIAITMRPDWDNVQKLLPALAGARAAQDDAALTPRQSRRPRPVRRPAR